MAETRWEHFEHGADIGVRGYGRTREEAFEQAAIALTAVIADPGDVRPVERVEIECKAPDPDILFVDWLNAILYEMGTRSMLFSRYELRADRGRLGGTAWGERVDIARHRPSVEVKAATYNSLRVAQREDGTWVAQCVVDV